MEDSCPATPLILTGRESKSPLQVSLSSPESDGMKSPSRDSPDSRCVICLGRLHNKSFTDSCLHQFCFQCLLQWSKIKAECPLCKQPFKSIIHNVRSNVDYDQYHVERGEPRYVLSDLMHSYNFDFIPVDRRFRYRSTMTREYFRELAESFLAHTRRIPDDSYQISPLVPIDPMQGSNVRHSNRLRTNSLHQRPRQRGTSDFRRNVYAQDLWVQDLVDISGRFRECTPQFYRENPAQIHRIIPWLNREVNVLLSDCESHAAYVLSRIISLLTVHPIRSREFREQVRPFFGDRTDHFIHELYTFAHSVYDIAGFDQNAVYGTNPNYATEVQEISSSEDSDIEILETVKAEEDKIKKCREGFKKMLMKRATRKDSKSALEPVAGPSGISGISSAKTSESIDICESDPEEVKVLDYVKPEPEIVTLSSGDDAAVFSDLDVSNGEYAEVIRAEVGKLERVSSIDSGDEEKSRRGKGKCKSNGFGLKGRQKRKYIKSKRRRVRSRSSSSSSSTDSTSSSYNDANSSDSSHGYRKSRKKKSRSSRKKMKKKSSRRSVHGKRRKHDTDSEKKKRKVKSYVIVPGRSLESSSSCGRLSRDSDEPKQHKHCRRKRGESPLPDKNRKRSRRDSLHEVTKTKKKNLDRSTSFQRDEITTTPASSPSLNQPSTSAFTYASSSSSFSSSSSSSSSQSSSNFPPFQCSPSSANFN